MTYQQLSYNIILDSVDDIPVTRCRFCSRHIIVVNLIIVVETFNEQLLCFQYYRNDNKKNRKNRDNR